MFASLQNYLLRSSCKFSAESQLIKSQKYNSWNTWKIKLAWSFNLDALSVPVIEKFKKFKSYFKVLNTH